jgi:hypothetical protein
MAPVEQHPDLLSLDEKNNQGDCNKNQAGEAFEQVGHSGYRICSKKKGKIFLLPEKMPGQHEENINQPGKGDINQPMHGFVKKDPSVSNKGQGIDKGNPVAEFFPDKEKYCRSK